MAETLGNRCLRKGWTSAAASGPGGDDHMALIPRPRLLRCGMVQRSGTGQAATALWIAALLGRGGVLGALWAGLVGGDPEGLALGLAVVPAAVWLSLLLMPPARGLRPWRVLGLLPGFYARSIVGGLDVARRAMDPRLPLAPGWLVQRVDLAPGGRVVLGAAVSLMPGTLAAGCDGDRLLVHVLDGDTDPAAALKGEVARLDRLYTRPPPEEV